MKVILTLGNGKAKATIGTNVFYVGYTKNASPSMKKIHLFRRGSSTTICRESEISNETVYFASNPTRFSNNRFTNAGLTIESPAFVPMTFNSIEEFIDNINANNRNTCFCNNCEIELQNMLFSS